MIDFTVSSREVRRWNTFSESSSLAFEVYGIGFCNWTDWDIKNARVFGADVNIIYRMNCYQDIMSATNISVLIRVGVDKEYKNI